MIFRFVKRSLPWEYSNPDIKLQVETDLLALKLREQEENKIFDGAPEEFVKYLEYCYELHYVARPDYEYLKELFQKMLINFNPEKLSFLKC